MDLAAIFLKNSKNSQCGLNLNNFFKTLFIITDNFLSYWLVSCRIKLFFVILSLWRSIQKIKVWIFSFVSLTQNDKICRHCTLCKFKACFCLSLPTKHENTSNRHCEQGVSLAWQSINLNTNSALWIATNLHAHALQILAMTNSLSYWLVVSYFTISCHTELS